MQLNKNGLTFSVDDAEVTRVVLERFNGIEAHLVAASNVPPAVGSEWAAQGGVYAGVARGRDGGKDYYLIIGPQIDEKVTWQEAMDRAPTIKVGRFSDYIVPTLKEEALAFANVPELFNPEFYWSSETHASHSLIAWGQYFDNGFQYYWFKDYHNRGRFVRRSVIQ